MDGCEMLTGRGARGFARTERGRTTLRAAGLTPLCAYAAYDGTGARLCERAADAQGALRMDFPAAGDYCLIARDGGAALWTRGADPVSIQCLIHRETPRRREKRYKRIVNRRFPRPPALIPAPEKHKKRYKLLKSRRFARRRLRARPDAPPVGALPSLDWSGAEAWRAYFEVSMPCAPVRDIAWRFVRAKKAGGGDCYLGMRAENDRVAEIAAWTDDMTFYTLFSRRN